MFNAAAKSDDLGLTPWNEKQGITVILPLFQFKKNSFSSIEQ